MAPIRTAAVFPVAAPYREPLFTALAGRGDIDLHVIYLSAAQPSWDVPDGFFATEHAYPARHLSAAQKARPGRTPVMWPHGLERALAELHPEVIVASEYNPAALRAYRFGRRHGAAHVVFTECTPAIDPLLHPLQLRLHRWLAGRADGLIAVSSSGRERLRRFGVPDERITVALQAADTRRIRAATRTRPAGGPTRVLSVGRLVPDKNHGRLIDALPDGMQLQIVGDGPLLAELQARAAGKDVLFAGHLDAEQTARAYADADAFALVSTFEPFGVAVREAMSAGLPILCSRAAGAAGDVARAGENAILVDPDDTGAIRRALGELSDPATRGRLAQASRRLDAELDGREIAAFAAAITRAAVAAAPRRAAV
jgi:glycosyltransferase involved in cell wall biosynthesis